MGRRLDEALRIKPLIQKGAQSLSDEEALEIKSVYPVWDGAAAYDVGDKVQYMDELYRCLQSHTAQETWNPVDAVSLWAKVLIPDVEVIPEWEQPDSTNPYMAGDKVTYDGKTWVSDIDNNVWKPGEYGWSEVE